MGAVRHATRAKHATATPRRISVSSPRLAQQTVYIRLQGPETGVSVFCLLSFCLEYLLDLHPACNPRLEPLLLSAALSKRPLHLVIKPFIETSQHRHRAMAEKEVPAPGPAKLKRNAGPDEWLEASKNCKYLSEYHMKQLCDIVKEYMMEGLLLCAFYLRRQLLISFRIKYPARLVTSHDMRRYSRPILRPARALPRGGWYA